MSTEAAATRVEAAVEHLTFSPGVLGVVVCDRDGIPIRDSFQDVDRSRAVRMAEVASELCRAAERVCAIGAAGPLDTLRVRAGTVEYVIKSNGTYILVVVQEPSE